MSNPVEKLVTDMKQHLPHAVATGVFSIADGLMLAVHSDVPDTNMDAMSAIHSRIWDRLGSFLAMLPKEMTGPLTSMTLETKDASFFIVVDDQSQVGLMAAIASSGNLGMLRVMSKNYLEKVKQYLRR